jgi:hypothetical protein
MELLAFDSSICAAGIEGFLDPSDYQVLQVLRRQRTVCF